MKKKMLSINQCLFRPPNSHPFSHVRREGVSDIVLWWLAKCWWAIASSDSNDWQRRRCELLFFSFLLHSFLYLLLLILLGVVGVLRTYVPPLITTFHRYQPIWINSDRSGKKFAGWSRITDWPIAGWSIPKGGNVFVQRRGQFAGRINHIHVQCLLRLIFLERKLGKKEKKIR